MAHELTISFSNSEGCHQTPFTVICSHCCLFSPLSALTVVCSHRCLLSPLSALTVVCSHRCLLSPSSKPLTGLTWCLPAALNYGVQHIVHWLWRQLHLSSTVNVCVRPVTHEFGLRTIPFGYLRSTNRIQSYHVSLDQYTAFFWTAVVCAQPVTLEFGLRTIPSGYDQVSLLLLFSGLHSYFL